jgi:hypothetical protein
MQLISVTQTTFFERGVIIMYTTFNKTWHKNGNSWQSFSGATYKIVAISKSWSLRHMTLKLELLWEMYNINETSQHEVRKVSIQDCSQDDSYMSSSHVLQYM